MRTIRRFRRDVPEIPRSREFAASMLEAHGATASDAVLLVVSELVTNAVRHGWGDVELRLDLDGRTVRIEVVDDGHADVIAAEKLLPMSPGGRGLRLVRELSHDWGAGFDPAGRTLVWAEVSAV